MVPVRDVPLQVKNGDLDLALRIDSATANVGAVLDKAETVMFDRLTQGVRRATSACLLDAMAEATEPAQTSGFVESA